MKKFYLFCNAGMSTSLLASKMQKVADEHKLPIEVKAFSDSQMSEVIENKNPDAILLGPQVRHIYDKTVKKYKKPGNIVMTIDADDYGTMNGERVLKAAMLNYKKESQK
ncbi:MAG: PTS sugar transporter subunit IIB [Anaerococcus sp.]|nr:PTS sugar transporter subunit IIB [Anaerococcus sp.]